MRPKAIIFDVDGTLYDARKLRLRLLSRFALVHCLKPADGLRKLRILRAYRHAHEELRKKRYRITGRETQLAAAGKRLGLDQKTITPVLDQWFEQRPLDLLAACLRPGLIQLLNAAKSHRIRIAAYSDYPCEKKLAAMGLTGYFEVALDPSAPLAGFLKPDPNGLRCILNNIGIAPEDAVYIGDRADLDAECARRAGMRAIIVGAASFFEVAKSLDLSAAT